MALRLRHFFARKVMFVSYVSAFVIGPSGFGTVILLTGEEWMGCSAGWAGERSPRTGYPLRT